MYVIAVSKDHIKIHNILLLVVTFLHFNLNWSRPLFFFLPHDFDISGSVFEMSAYWICLIVLMISFRLHFFWYGCFIDEVYFMLHHIART